MSERNRKIVTRLVNVCWFVFKWGLALGIVCALVALLWFHDSLDDEIRQHVLKTIADSYPDLDVTLDSARRVQGEGIVIRGLSITERGASGPLAELAHFDEIFLACRTELQDLLSGELEVSSVRIRRPTFRATRRPDEVWSIEKLFPLPDFGAGATITTIENGTVVLFDPLKNPSSTLTLREINLQIKPGEKELVAGHGPRVHQFEGSLTGDFVNRIELQGSFDDKKKSWSVGSRIDSLNLSPELRRALPGSLEEHLKPAEALRGNVALTIRASDDPTDDAAPEFLVRAEIRRGRVDHPRLPYPLTDVTGTVRFDQEGIAIQDITARSGRSTFWLAGRQEGYGSDRPLKLEAHARHLLLDRQLVAALPADWQKVWQNYQPAGEVNGQLKLAFDGARWQPELAVECVNVSFTDRKFPYRLERGRGSLTLKDRVLNVKLVALAGVRPVRLRAEVVNPGPSGVGYLEAQTSELPLDDRFLEALPAKMRRIVRAFAPQGSIDAYLRVKRDAPDAPWQKHYVVDLKRIALRHVKFPYPLREVRGQLEGVDRHWTFRDLVGSNDTGDVTCSGRSVPTEGGGFDLLLEFRGAGVPLDEELRVALPPKLQKIWARWKPQGRVNLITQFRYLSDRNDLDVTVRADLPDGIVIEPDFFPYRLQEVRGTVMFRRERIDFTNITARHDGTQISLEGHCQFRPDGSWDFRLSKLAADRLRLNRDLLLALPAGLRKSLASLNFSGALNMQGSVKWSHTGVSNHPAAAEWDLRLDTLGGRIDCGIKLEQINGGMRLVGGTKGRQFQSRGWLEIDSVLYNGFQFTQVQGPIWLGEDRVLLGSWAETPQAGRTPRRLTARLYGGTVVGDARIALGDPSRFELTGFLVDGDLARLAAETLKAPAELSGTVSGNLQLQGTTRGSHTLAGSGTLRLRDGDIYELPLVVSLLKLLAVKSPDKKAFNASEINFRIDGRHVLFDEINIYGDAISLLGKGEMDFEKNIRMVFHAVVGRDRLQLPIVRPVLGAASKQLMLIYVYGTLDNPQTTREALPGVRRAVQGIQEELEEPPTKSVLQKSKDWFDSIMPRGAAP